MRNSVIILLLLVFRVSAQTPVKSLTDDYDNTPNAYYKDLNNDFHYYEGTWVYASGNIRLTLVLQKKEMQYFSDLKPAKYKDVLIGGYSYKVNDIVLVNTLDQLKSPPANMYDYNLYSSGIIKNFVPPKCSDCSVNEKRIKMQFKDPTREITGLGAKLILRRITQNGVPKIKANLIRDGFVMTESGQEPQYHEFTVPFGEYVLTKVN